MLPCHAPPSRAEPRRDAFAPSSRLLPISCVLRETLASPCRAAPLPATSRRAVSCPISQRCFRTQQPTVANRLRAAWNPCLTLPSPAPPRFDELRRAF